MTEVDLPPGYSLGWSGQFQYMERAQERLSLIVPVTLALIVVIVIACIPGIEQPLKFFLRQGLLMPLFMVVVVMTVMLRMLMAFSLQRMDAESNR